MPKFTVYLKTNAETSVTVEAEDKDEAEEKALNQDMPYICAQCSGWGQKRWLSIGDVWDVADTIQEDEDEEAK